MSSQIKGLITAEQLKSVTTDICEKTTNNFISKSEFNKEIIKITEYTSNIPTKTSELTNDSEFITLNDIPTIPENVSELNNDSEFITKVVDDLVNYYLKSETYSKDEVDNIISTVKNARFEIVNTLPTDDIKTNVIYLVPRSDLIVGNVKEEFINLDGTTTGWERIGDTDIDLEGYVSINRLNDTLADYVTSANLNTLLASYAKLSNLSTVATSGNYNDLSNLPTVPTKVSELTNDSEFISTADIPTTTSDLVNDAGFITAADIPTIPTKVSDLDNDSEFISTADIPQKVSDLTNDLGFVTAADIPTVPTKVSELTNDSGFISTADIPQKVSDLTNDLGFITTGDIPSKTSDITNDSGFITANDIPDIPSKVSELTNDSEFITKAVNNLVNYYLKSESYSKSEVDDIISTIKTSRFEVVDELPTEDIKTNVIYIVPSSDPNAGNVKNELINLDGTSNGWEIIGSTDINLSGYITSTDLNNALADYTTTSALNTLLEAYAQSANLSTVATSGDYNDLSNLPTIPTKVSDLDNDSQFISTADIPQKVSDLTNDLGFITTGDIPSKTSDITNDSGFITANDIPSNVSDYTNDTGYITNTVNDLTNYYLKTEAYSKSEVDTIVSAIKNSRFEIVNTLPTEDIKTNVIYITPSLDPSVGDIKDEYINLDGTTSGWERIASTDIKITNYINRTDLNEALADYTTTADLTDLLNTKEDLLQYNSLPTASIDYLGEVFEYTGTTTDDFVHGYFYECVSDGKPTPTYSWELVNVQPGGEYTAGEGIDITDNVVSTKQSEEGDIDEIIDIYPTSGKLVSIVNAFNRGDIYSTDEKMIGQWIDGKPLYFKTVNFGTLPNNTSKDVAHGISNIEKVIRADGYMTEGTTFAFLSDYSGSTSSRISANTTNVRITTNADRSSWSAIVTLYYTKTSDSAISIGSENEYSTDEKVIGTWIDGKPVYQKVLTGFNIGATTDAWADTQSSGTLGIDIDTLVSAKILRTSDKSECRYMSMKYDASSQRLQYYLLKKYANCDTIIIQYTKST